MALEIEDGTGKANAQSYVSAADARTYALARGVALSATDADVEVQLINAMDYIEAKEGRMRGRRTSDTQRLSWPRCGAFVHCNLLDDDEIPANLTNAQSRLVVEQFNGAILMPPIDPSARLVKRTKVDVIEKEFFSPGEAGISPGQTPTFPIVDSLLDPLMRPGGSTAPAYKA